MDEYGVSDERRTGGTQGRDDDSIPYRKLVENAHEGIAIIQDERFVYCNERFAEVFGATPEELRGEEYLSLVAADERQVIADRYDQRLAGEEPPKQYRLTTHEGRVVELTGTLIEYRGRPADKVAVRDVSEHERYEETLHGLHELTQAFPRAETRDEIARLAVEIGRDILDVPALRVALLAEGVLQSVAADCRDGDGGGWRAIEPGDHPVWAAFADGVPTWVGDVSACASPSTADGIDTLVVPLAEHGVLLADVPNEERDDERFELVETLAATTAAALDRAGRESELRSREAELSAMAERFETVETWTELFGRVVSATQTASEGEHIGRGVCETFVEYGPFEFAWLGGEDYQRDTLEPQAVAGTARGYLSDVSLSVDDDATEPTVVAHRTGTVQSASGVVRSQRSEPWQRSAAQRGIRSVFGVPLEYHGVRYGVLGLYSSERAAAGEFERELLAESGTIVATCLNAHERQQALLTPTDTELDFEISDVNCFLYRFARDAGCTLQFEGVVPERGTNRVVLTIEGDRAAVDRFRERATRSPVVDDVQRLDGDGDARFRLQLTEPFVGTRLTAHGLVLRTLRTDEQAAMVTVGLPSSMDNNRAVDVVTAHYPDAHVVAKRTTTDGPADDRLAGRVFDRLTDRQRETLELAHERGYFDSPKGKTGAELAAEMGISSSTFHDHLGRAQRAVFESLFDDTAD